MRQNRQIIPEDQEDSQLVCRFYFIDRFAGIMSVGEKFSNFLNICILDIGQAALSLILFHEAGTDDTGRDRYGANTKISNTDRHDPAKCSNGIDITITHSQKRGHTPPDPAERITEDIRLGIMFHTVHAQAACQHQDHYDKNGRDDLIPLFVKDGGDDIERVISCIETEQMEDPGNPQHPEDDKAGQEEKGQDGQKVHDTIKRYKKTEPGAQPASGRIKQIGCPDPERIFDTEDTEGNNFCHMEKAGQKGQL